jgi:hypothetical protein
MGMLFAVTAGATSQAAAQGRPDAPPSTITLDRMDESARLGLQVGFDKLDRVKLGDGFAMRYEGYAQYVLPSGMVGLYGQLALSHLFNLNGDDATGLSNLDIGAFFLPYGRSNFILRTGLILPTGADSGNSLGANVLTGFERQTDFLLIAPSYTTLRLAVSTVQESGTAFFRGDFGFDLVIDKPAGGGSNVYLRANLAAGVRLPSVDLAVELVNVGVIDGDVQGGIENRFVHTLALGLRTRGTDQFHLGTVFPLDDNARGEIWILSLGYQHVTY